MPSKSITDAFVRNVKPPKKPNQTVYIHTIKRGLALGLWVSYGGSKTFRVITYKDKGQKKGQPKTTWLGKYPKMSVAAAFEAANEYHKAPVKFEAKAST